jgi:putative lipoic acid-binding regulatory protein
MIVMEPEIISGRPLIQYPCRWEYKIIGRDEILMRSAIAEIMADRDHELSFSRSSSGEAYCSLLLALTVDSEDLRNEIFAALQQHEHVRMVL